MEMPYKNKYDGDLGRTHKRERWVGRNIMEGTDIIIWWSILLLLIVT